MHRVSSLALLALAIGCGNDTSGQSDTPTGGTTPATCDTVMVGSELPAALYSIWGTSASDVYITGADDGTGPLVLHYDGSAWTRLATGTTGDLWWVWGDGTGNVWFAGEHGRVVKYDGTTFAEETVASEAVVLFGMWGSSPTDIWTVGGDIGAGGVGTVVRYDGTAWTQVTDLPMEAAADIVYKVWGSGPNDVWFVGSNALILHWDGSAWEIHPPPLGPTLAATTSLFTISGCGPDDVYGVGGFGNAAVVHWDGTQWTNDSPVPPEVLAPGFNGVYCDASAGPYTAGNGGGVWHRTDAWSAVCTFPATLFDFHGVWVDPDGGVWTAGGNLTSQIDGVVGYTGSATIAPISL